MKVVLTEDRIIEIMKKKHTYDIQQRDNETNQAFKKRIYQRNAKIHKLAKAESYYNQLLMDIKEAIKKEGKGCFRHMQLCYFERLLYRDVIKIAEDLKIYSNRV